MVATKTDLRKDSKKCNEVVSNGGKILQPSDGEAMAAEIKAKLYLECSALTQVNGTFILMINIHNINPHYIKV